MFENYLPIFIFLCIAFFLALLIITIPNFIVRKKSSDAKLSPYECGFDPIVDLNGKFDIKFYLIAILFIIFDLEIAFLFPWAIVLKKIKWYGFFSMMFFLFILLIGFIYEWKKGALEWD